MATGEVVWIVLVAFCIGGLFGIFGMALLVMAGKQSDNADLAAARAARRKGLARDAEARQSCGMD